MPTAVIVDMLRTPFAKVRGPRSALSDMVPDDMVAELANQILTRNKVDPAKVEDVILGCATPDGDQAGVLGRHVVLNPRSGLPESVAGISINRYCASSMSAVTDAAGAIAAGAGDVFLCGGVESMSRVPALEGGYNFMMNPAILKRYKQEGNILNMILTGDNVAGKYQISRKAQDDFALASHRKAAAAQAAGHFDREIAVMPELPGFTADDGIKPGLTPEELATRKPVYKIVTPLNSSFLTDGASMALVTSEAFAKENNLPVLARIKSFAVAGCAPHLMGMGPVPAVRKALERAGLSVDDVNRNGLVEINEAFAVQAMACIRDLGLEEKIVNIDGGAIALGHPLGASGARIAGHLAMAMQRERKKFGVATMCVGTGMGKALVLENPELA